MVKKRKVTRKTFIWTVVTGCLLVISLILSLLLWTSKRLIFSTDKAVSAVSSFYLEAMADRRSKTITNLIDNNFDMMAKAVDFIDDEQIESTEEFRNTIGRVKSLLSLSRFAFVDEDDVVYTQYTTFTGRSRYSFLAEDKMEERTIIPISIYGSSIELCLAVPTPGLEIMGKPFKACFVQIDSADVMNLLAFEDQGRTYFAVYTRSGENLSGTDLGPALHKDNIFEAMKGRLSEEALQKIHDDFEIGKQGSLNFTYNGADETLSYVPIKGTDWEMAVLIRDSVIDDQIRDIGEANLAASRILIIVILAAMVTLAVVLIMQYRSLLGSRIEAEKENSRIFKDMANTDSLTGVRNKHAYSGNEALIDQKIMDNECGKLAVISCDVNGLKHVNDTQGHAAGDKLIKDASVMICEYFEHGAVFRTGGDEFAVILQDKGYETMAECIDAFNRKVEENIRDDKVVISIGYSALEPGDKQLKDVFERADKMMYVRKKQLKEMGAVTRG
jgi:diguanylate cyclase (GGDEF)-like protein